MAKRQFAGLVVVVYIVLVSMTSASASTPVAGSSGSRVGQVLTSSAAPPRRADPVAPVYVADFETGDFSQVASQHEIRDEAITVTTTNPLQDTHTALVKAGPTDVGFGGSGNVRAEILFEGLANRFSGGASLEGATTWVTWEQRLDPNFEVSGWCVLTQFLGGAGSGWPMFAIEANGPAPGKLYAVVRGGGVSVTEDARVVLAKPVPRGTRLRFKVYHRWSTGSNGRVKVWVKGVLKAAIKGPNLFSGFESTPYHKAGIYRGVATRESRVKIDDVRWWTSDWDPAAPAARGPARAPGRR